MIQSINLVKKMQLSKAFYSIVRDPERTDQIFELSEGLPDSSFVEIVENYKKINPTPFKEQRVLKKIDLNKLSELPEDTLGKKYSEFMLARNLDPYFYPKLELKNEVKYFRLHLYQTHDIWHTVTGFNSKVSNELGLQAFYLAQMEIPLPVFLLAAGLLNSVLYDPLDIKNRMDAIVYGWNMGKNAKQFFGVNWDDLWELKLSAVREDLNIVAPTEQPQLKNVYA